MRVWVIIEGDSGSDQTRVIDVVDSEEKSKAYPEHDMPEHHPRWGEPWDVT